MYDSFWLGASFTLLVRLGTFKILKWPATSSPLTLVPQLIAGGLLLSFFDVSRRIAVEEVLKRQQANEFNKQMRKDEKHYDL